ncbi:MAG: leucine--tRNA ligase, partial [Candidatus Bathyarchaeia archaeon]
TLLKFPFNGAYLPAATFRPETVYGVTNMFINPDVIYVEAKVNDEIWIVSKEAALKLSEQLKKVTVIREFKGAELIGKNFQDPITKRSLPILPGWFVSPESATGVVYSVPAHAPADWIALRDLVNKPDELIKFGIDPEVVREIKPISLISIEGHGDYPAVEIVEHMGIKDQFDPRLSEATSVIYRKEFHTGVLKPICGKYAGKLVRNIKAELIEDFKKVNIADSMYDLPEKVVCRCTTRCIVKILSDQWFLRYSDPEWKKLAHEAVDDARIFPESARMFFHDKIDWLRDWACARRTGLGTPLPWSPGWIVETLSDSTVYMMFYTIVNHVRQYKLEPEQLTNEVFDYVFFGKGNLEKVAEEIGIRPIILRDMRNEFTYWYPVDLRVSAKELVPNHLSFFIFQHVALFPKEYWPRGISVNGMLTIEGQKMSKSKGNFLTLRDAVNRFGADVTRLALVLGAEDMNDPDWREENARSIDAKLKALYTFINQIISLSGETEEKTVDRWLISSIQNRIRMVTEAIETLKTRTAAEIALFEVWNDIRWHLRRTEKPNPRILREAASIWIRLLAPFSPYLCEELWHVLGNEGFVSSAEWPPYESSKINVEAEVVEEFIRNLIEDTVNVIKATKITPKKICYYTAASWKWKAYIKTLEKSTSKRVEMREIMKELMEDQDLKKKAKNLAAFLGRIIEEVNMVPKEHKQRMLKAGILNEREAVVEARGFLARELNAEATVYDEEDPDIYDPKGRAPAAKPYRPAIYIE